MEFDRGRAILKAKEIARPALHIGAAALTAIAPIVFRPGIVDASNCILPKPPENLRTIVLDTDPGVSSDVGAWLDLEERRWLWNSPNNDLSERYRVHIELYPEGKEDDKVMDLTIEGLPRNSTDEWVPSRFSGTRVMRWSVITETKCGSSSETQSIVRIPSPEPVLP